MNIYSPNVGFTNLSQLNRIELDEKIEQLASRAHNQDRADLFELELEAQNRELKLAHHILEEALDLYADKYDNSPSAFFTFDGKGCIQSANLTAARMLGAERDVILGKPFSMWIDPVSISTFFGHLRNLNKNGKKRATYLQLTAPEKGTVILISHVSNRSGEPGAGEIHTTVIEEVDLKIE